MKKLMITALAALAILTGTSTAQAEVLYKRLPNGQFVRVMPPPPVPRHVIHTPAAGKWQQAQTPHYRAVRHDQRHNKHHNCHRPPAPKHLHR